jgi:hypothetical protein
LGPVVLALRLKSHQQVRESTGGVGDSSTNSILKTAKY